jgi:serine/threonine-protein kinase ATR
MCALRITLLAAVWMSLSAPFAARAADKPLMRDFMGVCGHTVQFKPELYKPVCRLVRDYHPLNWDVGDDTSSPTTFPFARNRVDWAAVYGSWKAAGFETDACVMFDNIKPEDWKDIPSNAEAYGRSFGEFFGPAGKGLVTSVEIGNEPGAYSDEHYRGIFRRMAGALRIADPGLTIVTCNMTAGPSGPYAKSLETVRGLDDLYDAISTHTYAQLEGWPTWRRTFPEDPKTPYLTDVRKVLAWRDEHAKGKPVWITEFGWDASSQPAPAEGDFKQWVGSTETEQARYLVRSFLLFSAMDVGRAYIYFFNDDDQPQIHGSSGLTRQFEPKPAYHAVAHLYATLGDYRFARIIGEGPGDALVYEYRHGGDASKRVHVAWLASGSDRQAEHTIEIGGARLTRAERMPLKAGDAEKVDWKAAGEGKVSVLLNESPVYLWLED